MGEYMEKIKETMGEEIEECMSPSHRHFWLCWYQLSLLEKKVCFYFLCGFDNKEIAKKLLLKTEIVNDYTTAILKKFNISTQPKFMFFFYQHTGWDIAKDMIDDDEEEQCALWGVQKCLISPGIWKNM
jgi:DNA-binding NarL/FixJ family response regulator